MSGASLMLTVWVPLAVRKRGGPKIVLTLGGMPPRGASAAEITLLAPGIVEAILDGRQAAGMPLLAPMQPFPVEWEGQ